MNPAKILEEGKKQATATAVSTIFGAIYPFVEGEDEEIVDRACEIYKVIKEKSKE